jgi:hypothetical protein
MVCADSPELKSSYREEKSCLKVLKHVDLNIPPQVSRLEENLNLLLGYLERSLFDSGLVEIGHVHDRRAPADVFRPRPADGESDSDSNSTDRDRLSRGAKIGISVGVCLGVLVLLWLLMLMSKEQDAKAESDASEPNT